MSWLDALRDAGPLREAAQRFVDRERGGDVPRGASGLAWLARRIDEIAERDVGPQEEGSFVEGAGALLAVLLLDHCGEGAHVSRDGAHRVRLGKRGFFDPFAAIEAALEAESARPVLVAEVARAEAEASGSGTIARAAAAFESALAEARPELAVIDRFERRVWITGAIEIDLARAIESAESDAALDRSMAKLVSMLPGGQGTAIDREEAVARLLPRLVAPESLLEGLFARPMANGVALALVLAYEKRSRFVRARELEEWGLDADAAIERAIARLAGQSGHARFARVDTESGAMVVARSGDGLDSARLLLPGLHDVLSPELGSPFYAAVPHRDALFACAKEPALRAALEARARDEAARAPHRISASLFVVTPDGITAA